MKDYLISWRMIVVVQAKSEEEALAEFEAGAHMDGSPDGEPEVEEL